MMFLAHFSHTPLNVIEEWEAEKIVYWYNAALKLHKKMNPSE